MKTLQIIGFTYNPSLIIEPTEIIASINTGGEDCNGITNSETLRVGKIDGTYFLNRGGNIEEPSVCLFLNAATNNLEMAALLRKLADELDKV